MKTFLKLTALFSFLFFASCDKDPALTDAMLDGDTIFDPSLYTPEDFLVSAKYPNPSADDLDRHILIALHGYSATTFEWQEFADWSVDSNYRISQTLLDGHGRDYNSFKASTWEDWVASAKREFETLENLGYTKISFAGSSTGATILLQLMHSGYFDTHIKPKHMFLVDGIVVSSIKTQSIANLVGPMLVYVETEQSATEDSLWYRFRPQETIRELNELMKEGRKELESGVTAPAGTRVRVFHSKNDPTASSSSAVLMYKGLKHADGSNIEVQMLDSDIHVFTRLALRSGVTSVQITNQQLAFKQMAERLN